MSTSISFTHPVGTMYPGYVTRALMPYLIGRLGADGVTASLVVEPGDSSMFLVIKDLFRYNLSPLFVQLLEAPRSRTRRSSTGGPTGSATASA